MTAEDLPNVLLQAELVAFAIYTLGELERCGCTSDACIRLERDLYWGAIRAGLASQHAGRASVKDRVKAYAATIRNGMGR